MYSQERDKQKFDPAFYSQMEQDYKANLKEVLEEAYAACQKRGITLLLSHVNEQPMHVLDKSGFADKIGKENICENIDAALTRAEALASQSLG